MKEKFRGDVLYERLLLKKKKKNSPDISYQDTLIYKKARKLQFVVYVSKM